MFLRKLAKSRNEVALSLPEILISAVIIITLLLASAAVYSSSITVTTSVASRIYANQMAQGIIATAMQAPYERVATTVPSTTNPNPTGCAAYVSSYEGAAMITQTTLYPGLQYCRTEPMANSTKKYVAYLYVTPVTGTGYDGNAAPTAAQKFTPKRVTVSVFWFDAVRPGETSQDQQVLTQSFIRVPKIGDCIPPLVASTTDPASC